jgi:hypothetical protein
MPDYGKFKMGNLFDIHPTKSYGMTNPKLFATAGKTPVIVNSSRDNGVGGFVDLKPTEKGNIITFSDTTTADSIFYQPRDFIGYSHVQGVYPLMPEKWTKESLLYVVVNFRKVSAGRFDYATKFNRAIAVEMQITLPVKENHESFIEDIDKINFEYMTARIRELEAARIRELEAYLKVTGLTDYHLTSEEQVFMEKYGTGGGIAYKAFMLGDLFDWQPQKEIRPLDIEKYEIENGIIYPFYGQATINNGIISYLRLTDAVLNNKSSKPTILIHSNNQNTVYLESPFYLKDGHGATSVLQADFLNRENALFLMSCIKKVIVSVFSYNEKATKIALKRTEIKLPIDRKGNPDYDFMTIFIRIQQKFAIKNVVDWKDRELAAYRTVVAV